MNNKLLKGFAIAALATSMTACIESDDSDGDIKLATGTASFSLTDAPVDSLQEVNLTFTGIEIKPAGVSAVKLDFPQPVSYDLLRLQGGVSEELVGNAEIPAGEYNWIRLMVDESLLSVVDDNGGEFDLTIPSGSETGLKLVSGFTIPANGTADFTIDFDVRKSVVDTGDGYLLKPALRIVDNSKVGSISGDVDVASLTSANAACSAPATDEDYAGAVYVFEGDTTDINDFSESGANSALMAVPVTINNSADGYEYKAAFLTEGTYTVAYTCESDDMVANEDISFVGLTGVSVTADNDSIQNFQ